MTSPATPPQRCSERLRLSLSLGSRRLRAFPRIQAMTNTPMNHFSILRAILVALALSACASPPAANHTEIIGTWRWVSVSGRRIDQQFYARYSSDGKAVTWPAPKGWSDSEGVSRGRYSLSNGYLILAPDSGADAPKARIHIQNDQMTLTTDEGYQLVFRRIVPPVEPGRLADGSPAGFAQH
jgi:hypothetical protein